MEQGLRNTYGLKEKGMNSEELFSNKRELNNSVDIIKDLVQGDPEALKRLDSMNLDMDAIKKALSFITQNDKLSAKNKAELLSESWRINYRAKPPTPEEFITSRYLGPAADSTYPWVKQVFVDFMNPTRPYRNLILYPHIGWGKSYLSAITTLYISTCLNLMRDPWKYFNLNVATQLSQLLVSYSLKKSSELLLEPFLSLLEASPYFERCQRMDQMKEAEEDFKHRETIDKLYWTTAYKTSALGFSSGSTIKIASSPNGLLGLSIVSIVYSELSFFTDAGKALKLDTLVKMSDGSSKEMGELEIGDSLYHPLLGETFVEKISWEGTDILYEIEVDDGRTVQCNSKHLWPVEFNLNGVHYDTVVETQFMIDNPQIEFNLKSI